jgi:hypothetical protein
VPFKVSLKKDSKKSKIRRDTGLTCEGVLPGVPHHITQRGLRSMNIFSSNEDRTYYLELLQSASEEFGISFLSKS